MSEDADQHRTLDLALRVGEMLLSNGAGAADVTATMSSIAHHLGLRQALVDVTFTSLSISHQARPDVPGYSLIRRVTHRDTDFDDLTSVDQLVSDLLADDISLDEARARLAQISSTGHRTPRWAITVSWAVTGAGVAMLLGGGALVVGIAAVASGLVELLQRRMALLRLPFFYAQIAGGLLATLLAVLAVKLQVPVDPSLVVTAGIVMLLAGLGFIGALQDALTGFYVTAGARILEVMIATAGIIVGVSGGLSVANAAGVSLALDPGAASFSKLPYMTLGAAIAAAGFAFTAYAPRRALLPIALVAGLSAAIYFALETHGVGRAAAAGIAATVIGVVSYTVASWCRVPVLVVVVSAIVPLLPGLSIYRALSLLSADDIDGVIALITAAAVALSLAAGVILGEYVAQPVQREARRLESRLAGPRLVGPLRARTRRDTKR